jgi:hypothetical protein
MRLINCWGSKRRLPALTSTTRSSIRTGIRRQACRRSTTTISANHHGVLRDEQDIGATRSTFRLGRVQRNMIDAEDTCNGADAMPDFTIPIAGAAAGSGEWQCTAHVGYEYRISPALAFSACRPGSGYHADERVAAGNRLTLPRQQTSLWPQTSYDAKQDSFQLGRFHLGPASTSWTLTMSCFRSCASAECESRSDSALWLKPAQTIN